MSGGHSVEKYPRLCLPEHASEHLVYQGEGFRKPVRACVESDLGGYLIEIQVFGFRRAEAFG